MKRRWDDWKYEPRIIPFSSLEKALRDIGIELTEIYRESGSSVTEIRGYIIDDYMTKKIMSRPHPKKVKFSGPATIIFWEDDTKTVVKCQDGDIWNDEVGIAMCYLKKLLGNKSNFNKIFREAIKVADVRERDNV